MKKKIEIFLLILMMFGLQNFQKIFGNLELSKLIINLICVGFLIIYILYQNYKCVLLNFHKINIRSIVYIVPLVLFSCVVYTKFDISYYKLEFFQNKKTWELLITILAGVFIEELLFRIIVFFNILSSFPNNSKVILRSILYSNIIFGGIHIINFFTLDFDLYSTIAQVFGAFSIGVLFSVVFLKSENIYVAIIIHFLINFNTALSKKYEISKMIENAEPSLLQSIFGLVVIFILYSIPLVISYLIVKYKPIKKIVFLQSIE